MSPGLDYLNRCRQLLDIVQNQLPEVRQAAKWFADSILAGRMVHLFGSGHSRILVEEMWPRYGSFPGFNPIVELSLSFHNLVVGANGQRQAMFLENVPGLAERILRNFDLSPKDTALVVSSSGCNLVPIEIAEQFQARGVKVVAIISRAHSEATRSQRRDGQKLQDFADLVLDTGAPVGDAMVTLPGLESPVAPGSTIGGCALVNAIKAEVARRLVDAGQPPRVLTAPAIVGGRRAGEIFEAAYDEHARRMARLYAGLGQADVPAQPASATPPARAPLPSRDGSRPARNGGAEDGPRRQGPGDRARSARPEPVRPPAPPAAAAPAAALPPNWDSMDDVERRLFLRQQAAAAPAAVQEPGEAPSVGADEPRGPRRRRGGRGRGRGDRDREPAGDHPGSDRPGTSAGREDVDAAAEAEGDEEEAVEIEVTPEPEFPANWESMDDVERRLYLRQRAVAVGGGVEAGRPVSGERGSDREEGRRPRRRGGRGRGGGGGGGRGRRGGE